MSTGLEVGMFVRYQSQLFDCMPSMRADLEVEMFVGNQSHLYDFCHR